MESAASLELFRRLETEFQPAPRPWKAYYEAKLLLNEEKLVLDKLPEIMAVGYDYNCWRSDISSFIHRLDEEWAIPALSVAIPGSSPLSPQLLIELLAERGDATSLLEAIFAWTAKKPDNLDKCIKACGETMQASTECRWQGIGATTSARGGVSGMSAVTKYLALKVLSRIGTNSETSVAAKFLTDRTKITTVITSVEKGPDPLETTDDRVIWGASVEETIGEIAKQAIDDMKSRSN